VPTMTTANATVMAASERDEWRLKISNRVFAGGDGQHSRKIPARAPRRRRKAVYASGDALLSHGFRTGDRRRIACARARRLNAFAESLNWRINGAV